MTRMEVLSRNARAFSEEYYKPAVRDEKVFQKASAVLSRLFRPMPRRHFCGNTQLILKAACSQYLGYYPLHTPCKSEIKTILKEMARHGSCWESGIGCMERQFQGTEKAISEIRRYAKANGILPDSF